MPDSWLENWSRSLADCGSPSRLRRRTGLPLPNRAFQILQTITSTNLCYPESIPWFRNRQNERAYIRRYTLAAAMTPALPALLYRLI